MANRIGYGSIYNLLIRDGEPDFTRPVTVEYDRLLKTGRNPSSKPHSSGSLDKAQFKKLYDLCNNERDFEIADLQIQDGLPYRIKFRKEEKV